MSEAPQGRAAITTVLQSEVENVALPGRFASGGKAHRDALGSIWQRPTVRFAAVLGFALAVIVARRWTQFTHPDVWVEDGTELIPGFLHHGWLDVFWPTTGYLMIPAKLVAGVALTISFAHYPLVGSVIASIVQAAVVASIAVAPTLLPAPIVCDAAMALLPTSNETFGLTLYVFWWTANLLFIGLLWSGTGRAWPRYAATAIGAFSSPLGVALAPVFLLRALARRSRAEFTFLAFALACFAVQGTVMVVQQVHSGELVGNLHRSRTILARFFGSPLFDLDIHGGVVLGAAVVTFLVACLAALPRADRIGYILILAALAATIASSAARIPVVLPHPVLDGPRYYFYPTILTMWSLVWISCRARRSVGVVATVLIGSYLPTLAFVWRYEKRVPKVDWPAQVSACETSSGFVFDIQYGFPQIPWGVRLTADECRYLDARALMR